MKGILSKMLSFLGETQQLDPIGYNETWWAKSLQPVAEMLGKILVPMLLLLAAAGTVYSIVLAVTYAKAESGEKRDEARKRMVNAIIGFVVLLVLLILLVLFCNYVEEIGRWVTDIINASRK